MLIKNSTVVLMTSLMLCACISNTKPDLPALSTEEQAYYANISPSQLLESAEKQLQQANIDGFNLFAPETLGRMEDQLKELRSQMQKAEPDKDKLITLSRAVEQSFNAGSSNKELVLSQLSDVFAQKKVLEDIGVNQAYPGDYRDAVDDIIGLVKYIESGKPDKARSNSPSVMKDMRKLEVRRVNEVTLTSTKNTLDKAEDKDAEDLAKKSYEEAMLAYKRAVKYIEENPRDAEQIARLGSEALFYAKRAVWVAEEVAKLQEIKPKEFENIVLEAERRLQRISEAMRSQDLRDQNLHDQSVTLATMAEKLVRVGAYANSDTAQLDQNSAAAFPEGKAPEASNSGN